MIKTTFYFIGFVFLCYQITLFRSHSNAHIFGGQHILDLVYSIPSTYDGNPGDYDSNINDAITELGKYGITFKGNVRRGDLDKRFSYFCDVSVGSTRYYIVDSKPPIRVYQVFELFSSETSGLRMRKIVGDIYCVEVDCEKTTESQMGAYRSTTYMSFFPLEGHNAWFYWNSVSKKDWK